MKLVARDCEVLGTRVWIKVACKAGEDSVVGEAIEFAFGVAKNIDQKYSRFIRGNVLGELNGRLNEWVKVDKELWNLIKFGCEMQQKTEGSFDFTVKSILEGWGYDAKYSFVEKGKGSVGKIEMKEGFMVKLSAEIDIGGLGKGYAVDKMSDALKTFENFFVNAGGDIFARGKGDGDKGWKVYFENPVNVEEVIGYVEVNNFGLACTSANKRKWGNKHHLVDPKKLVPANQMLAVYTQAKNCLIADAYATALFVMGYDQAKKKLEKLPVEAMLVGVSGEIYKTRGFKGELFS